MPTCLRPGVCHISVSVRGFELAEAPQRRGTGVCASLSGEGPPTPVTCQRPPVPGRGDGGRATTRPERSVLSPRPASSPRLGMGGGRPGAGGLAGSRGSGRSRPVAAALSAKCACDPGPGDPPPAKGARKAMLLRPALPFAEDTSGLGFPGPGRGGGLGARAELPRPPFPVPQRPPSF